MNPADVPDELVQAVWEDLFTQPRADDVEALIAEINDKNNVRLAIAAVYAPVARYVRAAKAAELAAATARAETAEAALVRARQQNADLIAAWKQGNARRDRLDMANDQLQRSAFEDAAEQRTRAEKAEAALKRLESVLDDACEETEKARDQRDEVETERNQLRARLAELGHTRTEIAVELRSAARWYPDNAAWAQDMDQAARIVESGPDRYAAENQLPCLGGFVRTKNAHAALEHLAAEQGVKPVTSIDQLTAPENERLSDEEFAEWTSAWECKAPCCSEAEVGQRDSTSFASSREQLEGFLTDDGRCLVEKFMADNAGKSDDFNIDEVIAQNHTDTHRDWFGEDTTGSSE